MNKLIPKFQKGKVFYLHYPDYESTLFGGTQNGILSAINKAVGNIKGKVGHNAVITVDDAGHTKYYEYGRYNKGTKGLIGYVKDNFGNVVNVPIPDIKQDESDQDYLTRVRKALPHQGRLQVNVMDNVNTQAVNDYFVNLANNQERAPYSISVNPTTCATVANDAINSGIGFLKKGVSKVHRWKPTNIFQNDNLLDFVNPSASGDYFRAYDPVSKRYNFE